MPVFTSMWYHILEMTEAAHAALSVRSSQPLVVLEEILTTSSI